MEKKSEDLCRCLPGHGQARASSESVQVRDTQLSIYIAPRPAMDTCALVPSPYPAGKPGAGPRWIAFLCHSRNRATGILRTGVNRIPLSQHEYFDQRILCTLLFLRHEPLCFRG